MYVCICMFTHMLVVYRIRFSLCEVCICIYVYIHTRSCISLYIYIHTHTICTRTHTHTQTHTHNCVGGSGDGCGWVVDAVVVEAAVQGVAVARGGVGVGAEEEEAVILRAEYSSPKKG